MRFLDKLGKELIIFDGAMGTMLQDLGLKAGESPELLNEKDPDLIYKIHKMYLDMGVDVILTNTFGANPIRFGEKAKVYVKKAVEIAQKAVRDTKKGLVALDIGPCGALLKPLGEVSFDKAYESFKEIILAANGVDLIVVETMSDLYEIKACVLAAKENSNLPIVVSVTVNQDGKLLTGADLETIATLLEGLGVDAIGLNCGFGPKEMHELFRKLNSLTNLPVLAMPNAGMPVVINDKTKYLIDSLEFAKTMLLIVKDGAMLIGGCCGTTPQHMKEVVSLCQGENIIEKTYKRFSRACSYNETVNFNEFVLIGERINPTGKELLKTALRTKNYNYILEEAVSQSKEGAKVLDVNVGLPGIAEKVVLPEVVFEIQAVCKTPLQIDSSNVDAIENALRVYNGKAIINSVDGKIENMKKIFPIAKKYGAMIIALTLDEKGIPKDVQGRIDIAKKIIKLAKEYGIKEEDLIFDPLTLTISTGAENAQIVYDTLEYLSEELNVNTVLGISNISFGLPNRDIINSTFFAQALLKGLKAAIVNTASQGIVDVVYSNNALAGVDTRLEKYIEKYKNKDRLVTAHTEVKGLKEAIIDGLSSLVKVETEKLLLQMDPLTIVSEYIMKALDVVGERYESGVYFLPQLISSSEAAEIAFDLIKTKMNIEDGSKAKGRVLLATVKGDIHDIGKNIVKVVLENYGFEVFDLGKDVAPEVILENVKKNNIPLVGLSALMTTTVVNMKKTIELLKSETNVNIMVGGAVMSEDYAKSIGADFFGKDAISTANYVKLFFDSARKKHLNQ